MRIRSLILGTLVTACALALTSACGGGNKNNGGSGGAAGAAGTGGASGASGASGSGGAGTGDCNSFATASCNELDKCSHFLLQVTYGDMQTCVSRTAQICTSNTTAPGANVTPAQFATCQNAFAQFDCGEMTHAIFAPSECAVAGARDNGKPCGTDDQCKSSYCKLNTKPAGTLCGTCADRAAAGGACFTSDGCQSGLVCNSQLKCAQPVQDGGSCTSVLDCKAGLVCASGKCGAPVAEGQACTTGACDKLAGLYCDSSTNKCAKIQLATANQTCALASGTWCEAGGLCSQGTCQAAAADGKSCDTTSGPTCMALSKCVNSTCVPFDPKNCG